MHIIFFLGFIGDYCERSCDKDYYGPNCELKCHCQNNGTCNNIDGTCICPTGFSGKHCTHKCSKVI